MNQNSNEAAKMFAPFANLFMLINNEGALLRKSWKGFSYGSQRHSKAQQATRVTMMHQYLATTWKSKRATKGSRLRRWLYANDDGTSNNRSRAWTMQKVAQASAAMLSKIGIKVDLKTMPKAQYWARWVWPHVQQTWWWSWLALRCEDIFSHNREFLTMTRNEETGRSQ